MSQIQKNFFKKKKEQVGRIKFGNQLEGWKRGPSIWDASCSVRKGERRHRSNSLVEGVVGLGAIGPMPYKRESPGGSGGDATMRERW